MWRDFPERRLLWQKARGQKSAEYSLLQLQEAWGGRLVCLVATPASWSWQKPIYRCGAEWYSALRPLDRPVFHLSPQALAEAELRMSPWQTFVFRAPCSHVRTYSSQAGDVFDEMRQWPSAPSSTISSWRDGADSWRWIPVVELIGRNTYHHVSEKRLWCVI